MGYALSVANHEIEVLRSIIAKVMTETGTSVQGAALSYAYDEYAGAHTFTDEELLLLDDLGFVKQ